MYLDIIGDGGFELPSVIEAISSHANELDEFDKLHLTPMVSKNIINIHFDFCAHVYYYEFLMHLT